MGCGIEVSAWQKYYLILGMVFLVFRCQLGFEEQGAWEEDSARPQCLVEMILDGRDDT